MSSPSPIALCVTTYYPSWYSGKLKSIKHTDKIRGDLALEFAREASKRNINLVIVDGKSTKTFRKELTKIPNVQVSLGRHPKRSPGKRQAFKIAAKIPGVKIIVSTEPEKVSLITDCLKQITDPILQNKADVIVPHRNDNLFKQSYPNYMYESEKEGNKLYDEFLKLYKLLPKDFQQLDMFFGPRAFKNEPKLLRLFMERHEITVGKVTLPKEYCDPEQLSNTSFFPVVRALKKKFKVLPVEIPFVYPKLQKENELIGNRDYFEQKRKNQRLALILELVHFLGVIS